MPNKMMRLFLANNIMIVLTSLPFMLLLKLPSSACVAAETESSTSTTIIHHRSRPTSYIRNNHNHHHHHHSQRRVQEGGDDDESYLPNDPEHNEWYLPDLKLNIKKTWLFGAGDSSEWSGVTDDVDDVKATTTDTNTDNTMTTMPTLIEIPELLAGEYVTDVSAGGLHSVILTNEGRILTASGSSSAGEERGLGRTTKDGTELGFMPVVEVYPIDATIPTTEAEELLPKFVKVVASQHYTFAIDDLGNVWSTGNNAYAQLCLNDTFSRDRFHQVKVPTDENMFNRGAKKIIDVALGERHTLLLREDGKVFGCGWNQYGQLGLGFKGRENVLSPLEITIDSTMDQTTLNGTKNVNENGSNGNTVDADFSRYDDMQIDHEVITEVVAGRGSSYFLTSSGQVYATGTNYKGQLCLGDREDRTMPTMLETVETFLSSADSSDFSLSDEGVGVSSIASGASSLYLLLSNGMVLACGENTQGQLGIGNDDDTDSIDIPTTIANVTNATAVYSGPTSFGAYFVSDRIIYAVGFDGTGARENWNVPKMMACPNEDTSLKNGVVISTGNDHTLYLATEETTLECEGGSREGSVLPKAAPTTVPPTGSPSMTPRPTVSTAPTMSPSESIQPTQSGAPTAIFPSSAPTILSNSPSSSASPTSMSREGDTQDGTNVPTPFDMVVEGSADPTYSPSAEGDAEPPKPPPAGTPQRTASVPVNENGAHGHSLHFFGLTLISTCFMWIGL